MELVNESLIKEIKNLNYNFKTKLNLIENIDRNSVRGHLSKNGKLININKLDKETLSNYVPMACVDGSVNRYGGSHPHYIDIYQALGKISKEKGISVYKSHINSPMISENPNSEEDLRKKLLAKIEVLTAIEIVDNYDIKVLLMDGNLIRYNIEIPEDFEILKNKCEEKNIILAGFIKEAKSNSLFDLFYDNNHGLTIYDKDLLYGVLNIGEGYILSDDLNKKINQGFNSIILRTSNYPGISGIEVLNSQKEHLIEVSNICYSLTSKMSRGVPLIIDIVDKEVKIDNKLAEELIKSYIDQDIIERFFRSERSMRT